MSARIDADHITFTDDGHAWWVVNVDGQQGADFFAALVDRSCDTCDGTGRVSAHLLVSWSACPDCDGTGQHTFEIETEALCVDEGHPDGYECPKDCTGVGVHQFRVSVVPGIILPITLGVGGNDVGQDRIQIHHRGQATLMSGPIWKTWDLTDVTLPSAAVPGCFAVQLKVAT